MSKVRDLPELESLSQDDIVYAVEESAGPNGGRKVKVSTIKTATELSALEVKTKYESNTDTNAFTDAEKTKLAGIEAGATADQNANEVPYNNSISGLSAVEVQSAIDEVSAATQADFRPSIVSGRILHYTGGTVRFDSIFYQLVANDILLNQNITNGEVYVDLDGVVKQTGSNILAPPYTVVFAKFTTDLNNIISLTDERVKNAQNIVRGLLSDVRDVRAGAASQEGTSGRISDAMHKHTILTGAASTQNADQANTEGSSINLARADHVHNIPTDVPVDISSTNQQGSANTFAKSDHIHKGVRSVKANAGTEQFNNLSLNDSSSTTAVDDGSGNFSINTKFGANEFVVTSTTGLTINYSGGRFVNGQNGTINDISSGSIVVPANIPLGFVYVQANPLSSTGSVVFSTTIPILDSLVFARFTSDSSSITNITDTRSFINVVSVTDNLRVGYIGNGLTVTYNQGGIIIDGVQIDLNGGSLLLPDNIATGAIYVDPVTYLVTYNTTGVYPPNCVQMATYTTSSGSVTSIILTRSFINTRIEFGSNSDIVTIQPDATTSAGTANTFARADHRHAIAAATPSTQNPDQSNAEGVSTSFARADHIHNIPADAPTTTLSPATANAEGVGTSFARNDHTHAIETGLAADITTILPDDTASAGVLNKFARADHRHAIAAATPSTQNTDQTNTEGVSTNFARADHIHNIPTATVVTIGTANSQGASTSFARADHVHSHGVQTDGTLHAAVTTSVNGFMSTTDKTKLDSLVFCYLNYTHSANQSTTQTNTGYTTLSFDTDVSSFANGLLTKSSATQFRTDFNGYVRVSFKILAQNTSANDVAWRAAVIKNGTTIPSSELRGNGKTNTNRNSSSEVTFIVPCATNDLFTFGFSNAEAATDTITSFANTLLANVHAIYRT